MSAFGPLRFRDAGTDFAFRRSRWQPTAHTANYVRAVHRSQFQLSKVDQTVESGDAGIRRGQRVGPNNSASIHPYSLHASVAWTDDIGMRFVAYKQYFRWFQCQRIGERARKRERRAWRIRVHPRSK